MDAKVLANLEHSDESRRYALYLWDDDSLSLIISGLDFIEQDHLRIFAKGRKMMLGLAFVKPQDWYRIMVESIGGNE